MRREPAVAVGGGDPLRLAPLQQGVDDRMGVAEGCEDPLAGVGNDHPHRSQQLADLKGVAQVGGLAPRHMAQHLRIALGTHLPGVALAGRPRPGRLPDEALRGPAVHGQPVPLELDAQEGRGRLRVRGRHGPGVGTGEAVLLAGGAVEGGLGPRQQARAVHRPGGRACLWPQVAVGAHHRVRRRSLGVGCPEVEQVTGRGLREALRLQPAGRGPGEGRRCLPSSGRETVGLGDVPAAGEGDPRRDERSSVMGRRPPRPPRCLLRLDLGHQTREVIQGQALCETHSHDSRSCGGPRRGVDHHRDALVAACGKGHAAIQPARGDSRERRPLPRTTATVPVASETARRPSPAAPTSAASASARRRAAYRPSPPAEHEKS